MKFKHYISAVILFTVLFAQDSFAQNGGFAGNALSLGFGPRGMAVSNAMSASTFDGIYPYYNPALAAFQMNGNQVDLSISALDFDRVYQTSSASFQLPPNAGIAIGIIRSGVNDIDERSLSGYPNGTFDISEYQLITNFGIRFSDKFFGGVGIKFNYANYHQELTPATAVGLDIGILYQFKNDLNFAMSVQDLFANYTWNSGDLYGQSQSRNVVNNFPTRIKWGFSYEKDLYAIQAEYELQIFESEVTTSEVFLESNGNPVSISGINSINTSSGNFKLGGSWIAHERFTLRAGYRISDTKENGSGSFSTGFSVHLPFDVLSPSIDYAFVSEPYGISNIHVFALRLNL